MISTFAVSKIFQYYQIPYTVHFGFAKKNKCGFIYSPPRLFHKIGETLPKNVLTAYVINKDGLNYYEFGDQKPCPIAIDKNKLAQLKEQLNINDSAFPENIALKPIIPTLSPQQLELIGSITKHDRGHLSIAHVWVTIGDFEVTGGNMNQYFTKLNFFSWEPGIKI